MIAQKVRHTEHTWAWDNEREGNPGTKQRYICASRWYVTTSPCAALLNSDGEWNKPQNHVR